MNALPSPPPAAPSLPRNPVDPIGPEADPRILSLRDERCRDRRLAGGKGASLAALASAGFPVPPGFVVAANVYDDLLAAAADGLADPSLDSSAAGLGFVAAGIREHLSGVVMPGDLAGEIEIALRGLPDTRGFAVRSSCTLEDLAEAAFAGMHATILNCRGVAEIMAAIRACHLSLWSERAVAYRRHHGFAHREARMAVVVQAMVECDAAGVAFGIHPVSGDPRTMVINAHPGLGEAVVDGRHEVDHFEVDRASRTVTKSVIGRKTARLTCAPGTGGVREDPIEGAAATDPCLDPGHIERITTLLAEVDAASGFPQDIEWGFAGGRLFLLQARPITRIPPRWTRDESAERYPNAITPLTWDLVDRGFHESLAFSLDLMGMPPFDGRWFASFNHHVYGNQNAVEVYLGRPPFIVRDLDELRAAIPRLRETFRWVQDLPVEWGRSLDRFLLQIGRFEAEADPSMDDLAGLWHRAREIVRAGTEYFRPNIAISVTQAKLHGVLFHLVRMIVGDDEHADFRDALLAFCETRTWEINRELHELAREIRRDPGLECLMRDQPSRRIVEEGSLARFPGFAARFDQFLRDHGHREIDFDAYHPTWIEVPWVVLDQLRLLLRSLDEAPAPAAIERESRLRMHEAEGRLLARVPADLRFFFHELLRLARTYTALDDREHYHTTRLVPPLRRALRALGAHLVGRGWLDDPMDVFFSSLGALESAVEADSAATWAEWSDAVRANKDAYLRDRDRNPEPVLGERDAEEAVGAAAGVLRGIPGSPGVAEGLVYQVRDEHDFAGLPEGTILVARTTSPSWTPLFYSAAAVVTESGGPLSHGAVVARELHLPAVMAVRAALAELPNGTRVRVDGTRGTITRMDANP